MPNLAVSLVAFEPPIAVEKFKLYVAWRGRSDDDVVDAIVETIPSRRDAVL
jgi:hypothetical protein